MPAKTLLPILPEAIRRRIHDDLIVSALETDTFPGRMRRRGRERVHVRFGDELDGDGDVDFPRPQGFVVRGRDEAPVFVAEGDGVDGA